MSIHEVLLKKDLHQRFEELVILLSQTFSPFTIIRISQVPPVKPPLDHCNKHPLQLTTQLFTFQWKLATKRAF